MRIALHATQPPGGARRALTELVRRLSTRHAITLYSWREDYASSKVWERMGVRRATLEPFVPRQQTRGSAYLNDWRRWRDLCDLRSRSRALAKEIDCEGFDVVLADIDQNVGSAPFLLRFLRTPSLYYCHEPPRRFLEPMCRPSALPRTRWEQARDAWRWPSQRALDGWLLREERRNLRAAGRVLTNSIYTSKCIAAHYGRDADNCYLGVDSVVYAPRGERRCNMLLSVGALEPHKGFAFLIEAVGCSQSRPNLHIVGGGGHPRMADHLRSLAEKAGVNLTIEQGASDETLRRHYAEATIFVFAPHLEPFGLVTLEAMASGAPVIGVAEGGIPEIVRNGETGLLLERDSARWANAIDMLLGDPTLRDRIGAQGRRDAIERWTWGESAGVLERHLQEVANTQAREIAVTPREVVHA